MKAIRVSGFILVSKKDTSYHLGFYFTDINSQTNNRFDSINVSCIILLKSGQKINDIYENTTKVNGLIIYSYSFSGDNFKFLRADKSTAILLNSSEFKNAETEIPSKYQNNIKNICENLLLKL